MDRNEISIAERKDLNEKLTPVEIEQRIRVFGDFAQMNKQINTEKSETTHKRIQENPDYLIEYHRQMREEKKTWPVNPVQMVTEMIKGLPIPSRFIDKLKIGDFGCGEAELSLLLKQNEVYSFDHHNILNEKIIACDIKDVSENIKDGELDVAVFSLSLMGVNWIEYIREARRCLIDGGYLIIAETTRSLDIHGSLYNNEEGRLYELRDVLKRERFQTKLDERRGKFTFIEAIKLPSLGL